MNAENGSDNNHTALKSTLKQHAVTAALTLATAYIFYRIRMEWDAEMRLWRAVGDASFVMLWLALMIGPLLRLTPRLGPLGAWRRPLGVWSALAAGYHLWLVWDGWALRSISRLFGYEDLPMDQNTTLSVVTDPGFGLANGMGLVAFALMVPLVAVSSDKALNWLGGTAWRRIQAASQTVFYLVAIHVAYYLFLHYEQSLKSLVFRKGSTPENWFQELFVAMALGLLITQGWAFWKTVQRRRKQLAKDKN